LPPLSGAIPLHYHSAAGYVKACIPGLSVFRETAVSYSSPESGRIPGSAGDRAIRSNKKPNLRKEFARSANSENKKP
jgi:hypothetical protein